MYGKSVSQFQKARKQKQTSFSQSPSLTQNTPAHTHLHIFAFSREKMQLYFNNGKYQLIHRIEKPTDNCWWQM